MKHIFLFLIETVLKQFLIIATTKAEKIQN